MQTIAMTPPQLQHYLESVVGKALKDAPRIAFPLPIPVKGDANANWAMDLSHVDMFGYDDMVEVAVEFARHAVKLKTE